MTDKIEPLFNTDNNYSNEAKFKLQNVHHEAQMLLQKSEEQKKLHYDENSKEFEIKTNDKIYIESEPYDKRKKVNLGHFLVKSINFPNVELVDMKTNKQKIIHQSKNRNLSENFRYFVIFSRIKQNIHIINF